jgi:hypothetical protein
MVDEIYRTKILTKCNEEQKYLFLFALRNVTHKLYPIYFINGLNYRKYYHDVINLISFNYPIKHRVCVGVSLHNLHTWPCLQFTKLMPNIWNHHNSGFSICTNDRGKKRICLSFSANKSNFKSNQCVLWKWGKTPEYMEIVYKYQEQRRFIRKVKDLSYNLCTICSLYKILGKPPNFAVLCLLNLINKYT